jgi:hypothetical protein
MRRVSEIVRIVDLYSYIYRQQSHATKSQKSGGYCWPTPTCRNWRAQHAIFEGKKAETTSPRKSTSRTLRKVGQQYPSLFRDNTFYLHCGIGDRHSSSAARHSRPPKVIPQPLLGKEGHTNAAALAGRGVYAGAHTRCDHADTDISPRGLYSRHTGYMICTGRDGRPLVQNSE